MAKIKVLTKETARKSSSIVIKASVIVVYFKKYSKKYGVVTSGKSYVKNSSNLAVARRYK